MARRAPECTRAGCPAGDRSGNCAATRAAGGHRPLSSVTFALRTRTFRSLRRHHNYRLFFAGQVVSLAGSWMQNVALAWLVLSLSHSPIAVGLLLFCRFVPFTLFGLFAGAIVDRFETRLL